MSEQLDVARAWLKAHPPKRKAGDDYALVPDGTLVRRWQGVPPDRIDAIRSLLWTYTDYKNDRPQKFVDGVAMQGETMSGVFRCIGVTAERDEDNRETYVVEQSFRRGYLTSADWTEARIESARFSNSNAESVPLVNGTTSAVDCLRYTIKFPNVAPQYVDDIKTALSEAEFENPTVQDKMGRVVTLTGIYSVVAVQNKIEEDASHSVMVDLAIQIFTVSSFQNWATSRQQEVWNIWNVPPADATAIVAAFKAAYPLRSSVNVDRLEDNVCNLTLRFRSNLTIKFDNQATGVSCRFMESTSYHFGVVDPTDASLALPSDPTLTPGVRYERRVSDNGDGTYDVIIVAITRRNQTLTYRNEDTAAERSSTELDLGSTASITPIAYVSAGTIYRRRVEINDDCSKDIETVTRDAKNQEGQVYEASPSRASTTTINTQTTAQAAPTVTTGYIKRVVNTPTEFGLYETRVETVQPTNQTGHEYEESPSRSVSITENTESTELSVPTSAQGYIRRNESTPTEAGNFRTRQISTQPKNQTSTSYEDSAAASATKALSTENSSPVTGSASSGTVRRITNRPTEAGNYETVDEVIMPKNQTSTDYADSSASSATTNRYTQRSSALTGSASPGTIRRIVNRPTEAGNYEVADEVVTPKDQTTTTYTASPAKTSTEVLHTENSSALSQPSPTQGHIYRSTNTPTEAGNVRTVEEDITPSNLTSTSYSDSAAASSQTDRNTERSSAVTGTASSGTIRRIVNTRTEAGNYETVDEVITPKDQTSTSYSDSAAAGSSTSRHTENSAPVTGTASSGTIRRITNRPTEAGNYETQDEVITPKDQTSTSYSDSAAASSTVSRHTEKLTEVTGTASAGTIRRITNAPTEAGNYSTADEVIAPKNQSSSDYVNTLYESTVTTKNTESTAVTGSYLSGKIRRVTNTQTEAGNYRTEDEQTTPQPVSDAEKAVRIDAESGVSDALDRNQSIRATFPTTYAVGDAIVRVQVTKTPAGLYDNQTVTETPTSFVSDWFEIPDVNGTSYRRSFINVPFADFGNGVSGEDPLKDVTADTRNTLQASRNKYGLYDGIVTREPDTGGGMSNATYDMIGEWLVGPMRSQDGTKQLAVVILYTRSKADAQNYVRGISVSGTSYSTNADAKTNALAAQGWTTLATTTHAGAWTTGPIRDKGNGRYRAVRCLLKGS